MTAVTKERRALQRRILRALAKSNGMTVAALCKPASAPSRLVRWALEGLAREGHAQEHRPGIWRTTRTLGKSGGVGRRGPTCKCGGYGKRAFDEAGGAEWRCLRCDNRWPRITRLSSPQGTEAVDPLLRDLARAIYLQKNSASAAWFFRPKQPPKEKIPMKPAPRAPSISKLDQHDLALQAVRAAKKDVNGFATTGDTYETYLDLPIPPPYVHIGERHFRDILRDLGIQGKLELHHVSRGRHGATTFIREKPRPPLRADAHAES